MTNVISLSAVLQEKSRSQGNVSENGKRKKYENKWVPQESSLCKMQAEFQYAHGSSTDIPNWLISQPFAAVINKMLYHFRFFTHLCLILTSPFTTNESSVRTGCVFWFSICPTFFQPLEQISSFWMPLCQLIWLLRLGKNRGRFTLSQEHRHRPWENAINCIHNGVVSWLHRF